MPCHWQAHSFGDGIQADLLKENLAIPPPGCVGLGMCLCVLIFNRIFRGLIRAPQS